MQEIELDFVIQYVLVRAKDGVSPVGAADVGHEAFQRIVGLVYPPSAEKGE